MRFNRLLSLITLAALVAPVASAQAGVRIGIGFGYPVYRPHYYYRPFFPAVYVGPAPVYVTPTYVGPAPVYVQTAPVFVQPVPVGTQSMPTAPAPGYGPPPSPPPVPMPPTTNPPPR
jgi:hypothetical protein